MMLECIREYYIVLESINEYQSVRIIQCQRALESIRVLQSIGEHERVLEGDHDTVLKSIIYYYTVLDSIREY